MEELQAAIQEIPEQSDITLLSVVSSTLNKLFPDVKLSEAEQKDLFARLEEAFSPEQAEAEADAKEKIKSLGTALSDHFVGLSPQNICLYLADSDLAKAELLYCQEDRTTVLEMYNAKTEMEMQRLTASFEAGMYGFGGGYKDDPNVSKDDGDSDAVDLTAEGSEDAFAELQNAFKG